MLGFLVDGREEDDWDALRLLAVADDLGGFVAVHSRHVDVEQDDREFALQEMDKRLLARGRRHAVGAIPQHRTYGETGAQVIAEAPPARPRSRARTGGNAIRVERRGI